MKFFTMLFMAATIMASSGALAGEVDCPKLVTEGDKNVPCAKLSGVAKSKCEARTKSAEGSKSQVVE